MRTNFILDWVGDPVLRAHGLGQLNKGESANALHRYVGFGSWPRRVALRACWLGIAALIIDVARDIPFMEMTLLPKCAYCSLNRPAGPFPDAKVMLPRATRVPLPAC